MTLVFLSPFLGQPWYFEKKEKLTTSNNSWAIKRDMHRSNHRVGSFARAEVLQCWSVAVPGQQTTQKVPARALVAAGVAIAPVAPTAGRVPDRR